MQADSLLAFWREWAPPRPTRLGELAAPEGLPYDLRQAQALRALAAGAAGAPAGAPAGPDGSASCSGSGPAILLRVAADPSLPAVPCPLAAAAQCGELRRLVEVLGEAEGQAAGGEPASAGGQHQQQQPQPGGALVLPLVGVAPEERPALEQLVGCLAGRTHAGLLEATQLLDVARWAGLCGRGCEGAAKLGVAHAGETPRACSARCQGRPA